MTSPQKPRAEFGTINRLQLGVFQYICRYVRAVCAVRTVCSLTPTPRRQRTRTELEPERTQRDVRGAAAPVTSATHSRRKRCMRRRGGREGGRGAGGEGNNSSVHLIGSLPRDG